MRGYIFSKMGSELEPSCEIDSHLVTFTGQNPFTNPCLQGSLGFVPEPGCSGSGPGPHGPGCDQSGRVTFSLTCLHVAWLCHHLLERLVVGVGKIPGK